MAVRRGAGLPLFFLLLGAVGGYGVRSDIFRRLRVRYFPQSVQISKLSAGDFPAGVAAPTGESAALPLRPVRIGFVPRGSSAALLLATGKDAEGGLIKSGYALDARSVVFSREEDLQLSFSLGTERGGIDFAALGVDRLAQASPLLRDAAPKVLLLLSHSQGQDALAVAGTSITQLADLRGKRIAVYPKSSAYYFGLWLLSRAALSVEDVSWFELGSELDAGAALREGKADAALGLRGDIELASHDRAGKVLATTADAPHLVATVLVVRGDFNARYPNAVRRIVRGILDSAIAVNRAPEASSRLLGEVAPYLGEPGEAIDSAPPSELRENLSFFSLLAEAPVTYGELFESAAALFVRLKRVAPGPRLSAEETLDLTALKSIPLSGSK